MIFDCNETATSTTQCVAEASSSPAFINGFSYGEVLQTTFIFLIFLIILFNTFYDHFFGVKTKIPVAKPVQKNIAEGKIIEYD